MTRPTRTSSRTIPRLRTGGLGYDPRALTEDPPDPVDRASAAQGGQAFVPFVNPGAASIAQTKSGGAASAPGLTLTITLDSAPTVGNILVCHVMQNSDNNPLFSLSNGTWTQIETTVYPASTGWPQRSYYQVVTSSTSASTTITRTGGSGNGSMLAGFLELSGVDTLDDTVSKGGGTSMTDTLTPTASVAAILVSSVVGANLSGPALTPASGMTEWVELAAGGSGSIPFGLNYRVIDPTSGSYSVGSTGVVSNGSLIAASFIDTGISVNWLSAPFTIDGDTDTYEYAADTSVDAAALAFWRVTLADSYLIASLTAEIGFETAGSVTVELQGGNEADYSDAATVASDTLTATGSYTSDSLAMSWSPTAVYRYWQLVIDADDGVYVYEVNLLDPPTFTGAHEELTGRESPEQHPADAVSYDNTASGLVADNVQEAIDELADAGGSLPTGTDPGDLLVYDGDSWEVLAIGADDEVLTADSGETLGVKWAAGGGGSGDLVLLEQHTASSSAQLDFTTFLSSTYDTYKIEIIGIAPATSGAHLYVEVGYSGPTYDTGNNYEWVWVGRASDGTAIAASSATGIARVLEGITNNSTYGRGHASLTMRVLSTSSIRTVFFDGTVQWVNTVPRNIFAVYGATWTNTSQTAIGLRFIMSTGNIASGTIRIYGVVM